MITFKVMALFIISVSALAYFLTIIPSVLTDIGDYKYYRLTYDALTTGKFIFAWEDGGLYYFTPDGEETGWDQKIIYFRNEHNELTIKLISEGKLQKRYIFPDSLPFNGCPYKQYWRRKFVKWFHENIDDMMKKQVIWHQIKTQKI